MRKQVTYKSITYILLAFLFVIVFYIPNFYYDRLPIFAEGTQPAGSGDSQDYPIIITNESELIYLGTHSELWGTSDSPVYIELANDIEYTSTSYSPIGNATNKFYGYFEGNGHKITFSEDINVSITGGTYWGVLGYIATNSVVQNLSVEWYNLFVNVIDGVQAEIFVSGVVGGSDNSTITNCHSIGHITAVGNTEVNALKIGGVLGGVAYNTPNTVTNF